MMRTLLVILQMTETQLKLDWATKEMFWIMSREVQRSGFLQAGLQMFLFLILSPIIFSVAWLLGGCLWVMASLNNKIPVFVASNPSGKWASEFS